MSKLPFGLDLQNTPVLSQIALENPDLKEVAESVISASRKKGTIEGYEKVIDNLKIFKFIKDIPETDKRKKNIDSFSVIPGKEKSILQLYQESKTKPGTIF